MKGITFGAVNLEQGAWDDDRGWGVRRVAREASVPEVAAQSGEEWAAAVVGVVGVVGGEGGAWVAASTAAGTEGSLAVLQMAG